MDESIKIPIIIEPSSSYTTLDEMQRQAERTAASFTEMLAPIKELQNRFNDLGRSAQRPYAGIIGIENALKRPGEAMNNFNSSTKRAADTLKNFPNSSNQATNALSNLSRVAQDAPYGFIGIANNLNPLLESFQRLKASTGSTKSAFQALGASLTGAGGIGLALGIVSSLLVTFGDQLFGPGKKAKETKNEIDRLNESLKELSGTINERSSVAAAGAQEEISKVKILSSIVLDQTAKYKERNDALLQLKEINKSYFGDLSLESNSLKLLTSRVQEYSNALINAEIVKAFSSDIAKSAVETSKAVNKYNQLGNELDKLQKKYNAETNDSKRAFLRLDIEEARKNLTEFGNILQQFQSQQLLSRTGLENALRESLKFKPLEYNSPEKGKDQTSEIISRAKRIFEAYKNVIDLDLNILPEDKIQQQLLKSLEFLKNYEAGNFRFKLLFGTVDIEFPPEAAKTPATEFGQHFSNELNQYFKQPGQKYDLSLQGKNLRSALLSEMEKTAVEISSSIQSLMGDAIGSLAEGIGSILGGGDLKSAFSQFASAIAQGFMAIGKQMVAAAPIIAALKTAIKTLNPSILLPAGIALIGIGAALKASLSSSIKFASGGLVAGRTFAEIGEGIGTTRQNPEVVSPLNTLRSFFSDMLRERSFGRGGNIGIGSGGSSLAPAGPVELFFDGNALRGSLVLIEQKQGRLF